MRRSKICRMALIDPVMLKTRLGALAGRFDVDALDECDSTNSELMRRADEPLGARTAGAVANISIMSA
mgnify:CR=1 FL=1